MRLSRRQSRYMANIIRIRFEYTDYYSDKKYKFDITHDRHYGCVFRKTKQALKDFKHYCNTNERLYNEGKTINRFEKIILYRSSGSIAYVYFLGVGIMDYSKFLEHEKKLKEDKKPKERYKFPPLD